MGHFFVAPSGEERSDFELADLEALIAGEGEPYWSTGSGDAAFYWGRQETGLNIQIFFVPPDGFHLKFGGPGLRRVAAESPHPAAARGWAEIGVGGDAFNIHRRQVVSREEAAAILRHFAEHGTAAPGVRWAAPRTYDPRRDRDNR